MDNYTIDLLWFATHGVALVTGLVGGSLITLKFSKSKNVSTSQITTNNYDFKGSTIIGNIDDSTSVKLASFDEPTTVENDRDR